MNLYYALTNPDGKLYPIIKKILTPIITICTILFILSAYVSHIEIDMATPELYAALNAIFVVLCVLFAICVLLTAGLIVIGIQRNKNIYKYRRKSKLNSHVYAFDVINFTIMALFCVCCIYPIIYVLVGSFNQGADYAIGGVYFLPRVFTFENYKVVVENTKLWMSYFITISRVLLGTSTALIFTSIVGYAMSRPNLKFKGFFTWVNLFTMFFGGGLIPYFLIIKELGLYDNFLVYIIPGLYSVYNMIVIRTGFASISNEIHEAAVMDCAGEFRIWWQIYMPLNKPVLATVVLWLAVGHWNSYFDSMIYTNSDNLQTLQYFLLHAINTATMTEGMPPELMERLSPKTVSLAAIIVSIIPVLCFYPLIRKNFATGIMIGALKG